MMFHKINYQPKWCGSTPIVSLIKVDWQFWGSWKVTPTAWLVDRADRKCLPFFFPMLLRVSSTWVDLWFWELGYCSYIDYSTWYYMYIHVWYYMIIYYWYGISLYIKKLDVFSIFLDHNSEHTTAESEDVLSCCLLFSGNQRGSKRWKWEALYTQRYPLDI